MRTGFNFRLVFAVVLLLAGAAQQLAMEHRPSLLRPGLRMYAYVANAGDGTVTVVDLVNLTTKATVKVGEGKSGKVEEWNSPRLTIRAHPMRHEIWGASPEGIVWVLDTITNEIVARIPTLRPAAAGSGQAGVRGQVAGDRWHATGYGVDFSPDGRWAYAVVPQSGADEVVAIDCGKREVVARGRVGRGPGMARVSPDGRTVIVPNRDDSTVTLLDARTLVPLATIPVAHEPEQVAVLPDGSKAFVAAERSKQISVVDLRQRVLLANLPLTNPASEMVLKPDGGELYAVLPQAHGVAIVNTWTNEIAEDLLVGNAPAHVAIAGDAGLLYVTDAAAGKVMPIQINFRHVLPPIPVGQRPGACQLTPGEDLLLVVNEESNDLAVIRTRTQSLLTLIEVGRRPRGLAIKVF